MRQFVFDIDGTLSFDGQQIADEILAALAALTAAGHRVTFASARPIRDLWPIVPTLHDQQLIGANGALVAENGQVRVITAIPATAYQHVQTLIQRYDLDYIVDGAWNYAARVSVTHPIYRQLDPQKLAHRVPLTDLTVATKIILLGLSPARQRQVAADLRAATNLTILAHTGEGNLDLTAAGINKANTVRALGMTTYIAFGNDQNDQALLAQAQTSVWVTSKPSLARLGRQATYRCAATVPAVAAMIRQFI